jgi:hypothetical protein
LGLGALLPLCLLDAGQGLPACCCVLLPLPSLNLLPGDATVPWAALLHIGRQLRAVVRALLRLLLGESWARQGSRAQEGREEWKTHALDLL